MPDTMKIPGPDHPITIDPVGGPVTVRSGGAVIARSDAALCLREAGHAPVLYIPRADVDMGRLRRTDLVTHCPYKGDCSYYSIVGAAGAADGAGDAGTGDAARGVNAVWSYEAPYPAVAAIREYLAFYPDRVDAIEGA